jgi:V-type H+-transporting ATPase S1 subunit
LKKVYSKPLVRKARQVDGKQEDGVEEVKQHVIVKEPKFIIALSKLHIGEKEVDVKTLVVNLNETAAETSIEVNLVAGTDTIGMKFELSGGTWSAKQFSYNGGRFFTRVPISAYDHKSFGCVDLRLSNAKMEIIFEDIQIQPFFHSKAADDTKPIKFADYANDCVGFFSPAIWGALFVVIILLSILSCGLTAMMDIRTMDRFDDPKGKTITINAQE